MRSKCRILQTYFSIDKAKGFKRLLFHSNVLKIKNTISPMELSMQANNAGMSKICFLFLSVIASGSEMGCILHFQMIKR